MTTDDTEAAPTFSEHGKFYSFITIQAFHGVLYTSSWSQIFSIFVAYENMQPFIHINEEINGKLSVCNWRDVGLNVLAF